MNYIHALTLTSWLLDLSVLLFTIILWFLLDDQSVPRLVLRSVVCMKKCLFLHIVDICAPFVVIDIFFIIALCNKNE